MNQTNLSISLVIPAYNEERHVSTCLDSIAAQTVPPNEVIVVDNQSSDKTSRIAKRYPFVRVLTEPTQGIVFARNTGFDAVKSTIIGRIDADTILPNNWVEYVLKFYSTPGHLQTAWSGGGHFYNVRLTRLISALYNMLVFQFNRLLLGHDVLWGSNMTLTKAQWQRVRKSVHNHIDIHEDLDLAMHLERAGYHVVYDRAMHVQARLRGVNAQHHELWEYLQWWPRTLRVHKQNNWVICWLFGCLGLYLLTPLLSVNERVAHIIGRPALPD